MKYELLETYGKYKLWIGVENPSGRLWKITYKRRNQGLFTRYDAAKEEFDRIKETIPVEFHIVSDESK